MRYSILLGLSLILFACGQTGPVPEEDVHQQRITAADVFGDDEAELPVAAGDAERGEADEGAASPEPTASRGAADARNRPRNWALVHVFVALCDPDHQGVARVPEALGDGDDPDTNLYWGAMYGVRTFLARHERWRQAAVQDRPREGVLQRAWFRHRERRLLLVADAYRGAGIEAAVADFLGAASGAARETVALGEHSIELRGGADLVVYVGHNGLMDFAAPEVAAGSDGPPAMVLACHSRRYFSELLAELGSAGLLLTNGRLAPEAYILAAAVESWHGHGDAAAVAGAAGKAYAAYQNCPEAAALKLFAPPPR